MALEFKFRSLIGVAALACVATAAMAAESSGPNVTGCTLIRAPAQLQAMRNNLAGVYCLANDIDAKLISNFIPIGTNATPFTGRLYGNGHVIRNLTIKNSTANADVGLFGYILADGLIQDLGLININVTSSGDNTHIGGLVGFVQGNFIIRRVYSTGHIKCTGICAAGGLIGQHNATLEDSWSLVDILTQTSGGGLVALMSNIGTVTASYATGSVSNTPGGGGVLGGLAGENDGLIQDSYATGAVTGGVNSGVGGLVGTNIGTITRSYATGPTHGGTTAGVAALIGTDQNGIISQTYGAGRVTGDSGAHLGGVIGLVFGAPAVTNTYWDTVTTGQATTANNLGTGRTTAQLREALPSGFSTGSWAITHGRSYPFLNAADQFTSPLATLVTGNKIFTFVPIGQLDVAQYIGTPHHADGAALAAVYTMIARAIGIADNVAQLKGVKINKYFWHDAMQTTTFAGPVTSHATLTALKNIAPATHLNATNVIGHMNVGRLVILRGSYSKAGGGTGTHWMLATLYTRSGAAIGTVVANDPWTGAQVEIDPVSKQILTPRNFPLANFTVNGFQAVTVN